MQLTACDGTAAVNTITGKVDHLSLRARCLLLSLAATGGGQAQIGAPNFTQHVVDCGPLALVGHDGVD